MATILINCLVLSEMSSYIYKYTYKLVLPYFKCR